MVASNLPGMWRIALIVTLLSGAWQCFKLFKHVFIIRHMLGQTNCLLDNWRSPPSSWQLCQLCCCSSGTYILSLKYWEFIMIICNYLNLTVTFLCSWCRFLCHWGYLHWLPLLGVRLPILLVNILTLINKLPDFSPLPKKESSDFSQINNYCLL